MDREHPYAEMVGRTLRMSWAGPPSRCPTAVTGRLVGAVERALRERQRKRRLLRNVRMTLAGAALGMGGVVAVALCVSPWHSSRRWGHGAPDAPGLLARPAERTTWLDLSVVGSGARVDAGAGLRAPGPMALRMRNRVGTELTLEPGASLSVIEAGRTERFALLEGTLDAHVARLSPGERFIVAAGDAQIEVHGTRFRISVGPERASACGGSPVTRVTVTEGIVAVRSGGVETKLVAGEDWRTTCPAVRLAASAGSSATAPGAATPLAQLGGRAAAATRPAPSSSSLEAQNELFSAAMRAKLAGRTGDALDLLGQFVDEYPDSALFESAMVQRMRLAAAEDPTWATSVATQYLTRFPDGFGRPEAQEIIGLAAPP